MMFTIDVLPARYGDSLWIEYGDRRHPHRILIDGGPSSPDISGCIRDLMTERVGEPKAGEHDFELIVVTHVDSDHIAGMLRLFDDESIHLAPGDVWFNAWRHLPNDLLGAKQGERLSTAINNRGLAWNNAFDDKAVMVPTEGPLPVVELPGGLRLTLLSPSRAALAALRPKWQSEVQQAGMIPGEGDQQAPAGQPDVLGDGPLDPDQLAEVPFVDDKTEANGSSIAFLAEFDGRSLLVTGDAHAGILADGLRRLKDETGQDKVRVDAFKLPHHGSRNNLNRDILDLVDCRHYLFSSNGKIYGHPHPETVSRIVTTAEDTALEFNYHTTITDRWDSARMKRKFHYTTAFPDGASPWLHVEI
jgi:hypothetical protein